MRHEQLELTQPMQAALDELKGLIHARFPEATFTVSAGEDPEGIYLSPTIDVEDTDEVIELVLDRLLELQVDQELPLYVVPVLPIERVAEQLKRHKQRQLPSSLPQAFHAQG